ncbi:hypothetical protein [Absidia glauca]|uniref:RING-type domain-containing protein n=1 Tax=Absidia glauca TaxID=4829 RepID=A0A168MP24_ABSGL|nr:hypothetical protein [Absidia glauca]
MPPHYSLIGLSGKVPFSVYPVCRLVGSAADQRRGGLQKVLKHRALSFFLDLISKPMAALCCGHVFHHACISGWVATKALCPLCKKKVPANHLPIQPLFLDIPTLEPNDTDPSMTTERRLDDPNALCASLKQQLATAQKKCEDQQRQFDSEKKDYLYKIKKYKEYRDIKRVVEMKQQLSRSELQTTMDRWRRLPQDELALRMVVLFERNQQITTENDELNVFLDRSYQRIDELKKRVKDSNKDSQETTIDPSRSLKRRRLSFTEVESPRGTLKRQAIDVDPSSTTSHQEPSSSTFRRSRLRSSTPHQIIHCDDDSDDNDASNEDLLRLTRSRSTNVVIGT